MTDEPLLPMDGLISYRTMSGKTVTVRPVASTMSSHGLCRAAWHRPRRRDLWFLPNYVVKRMAKTYPKCELARHGWTGGRKSDILVRAAACSKWEFRLKDWSKANG